MSNPLLDLYFWDTKELENPSWQLSYGQGSRGQPFLDYQVGKSRTYLVEALTNLLEW
jgi:hypothetical protein